MNKKILSAVVVSLLLASSLSAASLEVAVLYNGNTPANVDGLHFISQQFSELSSYKIQAVKDPKDIQPGKYRAILVLSTGLSSGIDRNMANFIASWQKKSEVILVSLKKGSSDRAVSQFPPSAANLDVDALTAASAWSGKGLASLFGGKHSAEYDMHLDWVKRVIALIDKIQ